MKVRAKLREWASLFSEYVVAQGAIQLLGVLAGLWLINLLPVREYALYTLALSVLTFLAVFSDLGISSALLYFRRETRITNSAFGPYVRAALRLRRGLLAIGAFAGLAFMFIVAPDRGFAPAELIAVAAMLVATIWLQVDATTALLQLRLAGRYRQSYLAELCGNALRLLGVAAMWLAIARSASLAMLMTAIGSLATSRLAGRYIPGSDRQSSREEAAADRAPIVGIVRYVMPMSLSAAYFSIQAPLTVWLSAFFAGTESIAQVGALGRLGIVFSLLSGFIGTVLIPRLSAVSVDAHYLRRYMQCWTVLLPFGAVVVAIAYWFPHWLLLLLGSAYDGLEQGVLLVAITAVLSNWGGYLVGINNSRGWVRTLSIVAIVYAVIQVLLVIALDLSTTMGVLQFGLWSSLCGLFLQIGINAAGFLRPAWVAVRQ